MNRLISPGRLAVGLTVLAMNSPVALFAQENPERRERQENVQRLEQQIRGLSEQIQMLKQKRQMLDRDERPERGPQEENTWRPRRHSRREARTIDERAEHVKQAIKHLVAAGWPDEAARLKQRLVAPDQGGPPRPQERGPWGQFAEEQMGHVHQAIGQLSQAVQRLEERSRDSEHVAEAADQAHRRIEELRRQAEERSRELEEHFGRRVGETRRACRRAVRRNRTHVPSLCRGDGRRVE